MAHLLRLAFSCLAMVIVLSASASVKEWTGIINDQWNVASNWIPIGIPTAVDSVESNYFEDIVIPFGYNAVAKNAKLLGKLSIFGSLTIDGGKLEMLSDFSNYGNLTVLNSPDYGISFSTPQISDTAQVINQGVIYVDNTGEEGILGPRRMKLYNESSGIIEITNYTTQGLFVEFLNNKGIVRIDGSGSNAIYSDISTDSLLNESCGKMSIFNAWNISSGVVINAGFIRQDSDKEHVFSQQLINYGVLEDINYDFEYSDINNQAVWIKRYSDPVAEGADIPIFNIANASSYTFSDVYKNKALTNLAGEYNQYTNTWIPNENAIGDSILFIELTHIEGCKDTIKFTLEQAPYGVNYWVGGIGNWNVPSNWSFGSVPIASDQVAIYNKIDEVKVPNGYSLHLNNLYVQGKFKIANNAIVYIQNNAGNYTITCDSCEIVNNGVIDITNVDYGIEIENGKLNNYDSINCTGSNFCINIDGSSQDTGVYIKNYSVMTSTDGNMMHSNSPPVYNYGTMHMTNPISKGINVNELVNEGTINGIGQGNVGTGIIAALTNRSTGNILLSSLDKGLSNQFSNEGVIEINNCTQGAIIYTDSENQSGGELILSNNETGIFIVTNKLTNLQGGDIEITGGELGILCSSSNSFTTRLINEGSLSIDEVAMHGIEINGVLENIGQASINIDNCGENGIALYSSLINSSSIPIKIKNCSNNGLLIESGVFTNNVESGITIDSVGNNAIEFISNQFVTDSWILNYGSILVGPNVGNFGLLTTSFSDFQNYHCNGKVISFSPFDIQGTFNNQGIFQQIENVPSFANDFINTGSVWDTYDVFSTSNVTNQGYRIVLKTGQHEAGVMIQNLIDNGFSGSPSFTISPAWFLDENLSLNGGTYNAINNSFIPNNTAIDSSVFYFEVVDNVCNPPIKDTMRLYFENPILSTCGNITWLGGKGSWTDSMNWDRNRMPNACDSVIIDNILDTVQLDAIHAVELSHLKNAGNLVITNISQLNISNAFKHGVINAGKINNQGSLQITNAADNGYVGQANSTTLNSGNMVITNSGNNAIVLTNCTAQNTASGQITLENSVSNNLVLKQNAILHQLGYLLSK